MQRADKPGLDHTFHLLMQHECFSIRCGNCCSSTVGGKARGKNTPFGVALSAFSESGQVPISFPRFPCCINPALNYGLDSAGRAQVEDESGWHPCDEQAMLSRVILPCLGALGISCQAGAGLLACGWCWSKASRTMHRGRAKVRVAIGCPS